MKNRFYLVFSLHDLFYGIDTLNVQRIVDLPELTPAIAAPPNVVGVVNVQGKIVPVMDLNRQFGQPSNGYQLSDRVIFLKDQDNVVGIIVNQVQDVQAIDSDCIDTQFVDTFSDRWNAQVSGIANLDGNLITLLNPEKLFQAVASPLHLNAFSEAKPETCVLPHPFASSNFSSAEQAILRDRARNLMQLNETENTETSLAYAVLRMSGEYFGIELETVREFAEIRSITPIPCCPAHIVGNINLRGEIVTLISLHKALNVAKPGSKQAIVVTVDEITAGITVDEVLDVVYVHPSTVQLLPTATRLDGQDYSKGIASYGDRTMTLVDLPKLLTQNELVVNESV